MKITSFREVARVGGGDKGLAALIAGPTIHRTAEVLLYVSKF